MLIVPLGRVSKNIDLETLMKYIYLINSLLGEKMSIDRLIEEIKKLSPKQKGELFRKLGISIPPNDDKLRDGPNDPLSELIGMVKEPGTRSQHYTSIIRELPYLNLEQINNLILKASRLRSEKLIDAIYYPTNKRY